MIDNCLPTRGDGSALGIDHQIAILFGQKEAGGHSIDPDTWTVLLRHMHCQPLREVGYGCLGRAVGWHAGQGSQSAHGGDVDDAALSAVSHAASKNLATLEGSRKIQVGDAIGSLRVQIKEALLS